MKPEYYKYILAALIGAGLFSAERYWESVISVYVANAGERPNLNEMFKHPGNACERTYANGDVKYGDSEVYQFHVNTTAQKVCMDVSNAFGLGQDLDCSKYSDTGPDQTVYVDMSKGHYVCLKGARYIGPPIDTKAITKQTTNISALGYGDPKNQGDYCFDLYEMTER